MLCVYLCVSDEPGEGWTGVVGLVVCRPLTSRITGGRKREGRARRAVRFRTVEENDGMKRAMRMRCLWYSGGVRGWRGERGQAFMNV